jgi:hypothetical protein
MTDGMGERFVRTLAAKDADGLKALLTSDVDFRAMTPGKFWEGNDADVIVDEIILGTWFDPERRIIEVLAIDHDRVGSLDRVGYRFRVGRPDGEFIIEQQAYLQTEDSTISWLRIMCSGFVRAD